MTYRALWTHMDEDWMWRVCCINEFGELAPTSPRSYFDLADAKRALETAQASITNISLAA